MSAFSKRYLMGYRIIGSAALLLTLIASTHCAAFGVSSFTWRDRTTISVGVDNICLSCYGQMSTEILAKDKHQDAATTTSTSTCFHPHEPPYLVVITEPDACDTEERMAETIRAVTSAVSTGMVALVSVRVVQPENAESSRQEWQKRVVNLTCRLVELSNQYQFKVVVTSDWVDEAVLSNAHGIHVKERHQYRIPEIRQQFAPSIIPIIGTSAHAIKSAVNALNLYQPDYFLVGTCYPTESHPEKTQQELEGPSLAGRVVQKLETYCIGNDEARPIVLAIGGINSDNCAEPVVTYGADGVAAIRSVLQSADPADAVTTMFQNIKTSDDGEE